MQIFNALQLKNGAIPNKSSSISRQGVRPTHFTSYLEKDDAWVKWNADYIEQQTMDQIRRRAPKYLRNLRLANGVIDKSDYIQSEENEYSDIFNITGDATAAAYELQFFPIIPSIINLLRGEFSGKMSKVMFRAVDDQEVNSRLAAKKKKIEQILIQEKQQELAQQLINQGMDPNSEEMQQALSPQNIMSLPELEKSFKETYRSQVEEYCTHQKNADQYRFNMDELEERQFVNLLTYDREFWAINMMEDDYSIEEWDVMSTGYAKSWDTRYLSDCNWVSNIQMLTPSDALDKYGWLMTADQQKSLEGMLTSTYGTSTLTGADPDLRYDGSKSWTENMNLPSTAYRQYKDYKATWESFGSPVAPGMNFTAPDLIRTSTTYFKTQRLVYHLTKITDAGELIQDIVSENYQPTTEPLYDTRYQQNKDKYNLVYGEHLDALWINEVWGVVKLGINRASEGKDGAIYLGINQNKPGRLRFQFKSSTSLYGAKLPVEGWLGSDKYIDDCSLVRGMTSYQLLHNMAMNQINDIMINEQGMVLQIDTNVLPKQSLGEDWAKGDFEKAYQIMKDFQILPIDTTLANTEGAIQQNNFPVLDFSQTQRLLGRINIAKYFKEEAYATIGVTPQRLGEVTASESATGTEAALNNSFAQTEKWFTIHSDWVMPRVYSMMINAAQYYNSTKPSVRLQYVTNDAQKIDFQIDGVDWLAKDFNVFATTQVKTQKLLNQLKQLAIQNNTTGGSLFDLSTILKAESVAEIDAATKAAEDKIRLQAQQQHDYDMEMEQKRQEGVERQQAELRDFEWKKAVLDANTEKEVAYIKASGYGNGQDTNANGQSDFLDNIAKMEQNMDQFNQKMDHERTKEQNKKEIEQNKMQLQREKLQAENNKSANEVKVAKINK